MATTRNLYGKPIERTADGFNFVCCAYYRDGRKNLYWGILLDENYLPIPTGGELHFRLGGSQAVVGLFDPEDGSFTSLDTTDARNIEANAQPIGGTMELAQLAEIIAYTIERDVADVNSYLNPTRLAHYVSLAVVRAAYNTRLIGGKMLDEDVRHLHDVVEVPDTTLEPAVLSNPGHRNGRFLDSWAEAWSGFNRRLHGPVINLTAQLMAVMLREIAYNAVRDFKTDGRKPTV